MRTNLIQKSLLASLVAITAASSIPTSQAAEGESWYNGFYLAAGGGGQTRGRAQETPGTFTDWDEGWLASVGIGYEWCKNFRNEVEVNWFQNDAERVAGPVPFGDPGTGSGEALIRAVMFNFIFSYPIPNTRWTPYVGGGVGFYSSDLQDLTNPNVAPFGVLLTDKTPEAFAWQVKVGIGYALTDWLEITAGYRYFDGDQIHFYFNPYAFGASPKTTDYHAGEMGLRFRF